jgi:hypothetical protein
MSNSRTKTKTNPARAKLLAAAAMLAAGLIASSMQPPQAPAKPGDLKVAVGLIAKVEREHRMFEARLYRLEQLYTDAQAADKLARVKALRAKHMQSYLKSMDGFGSKFGEDAFAKFRTQMDAGRKRTPGNAEAIRRKVNAKSGTPAPPKPAGTPASGGQK